MTDISLIWFKRIKKYINTTTRGHSFFSFSLIFLESLYPLQDRGVGVVPGGEQPVVDGEAEVVVVQLHQGRLKVLGFPHLSSKLVSLKE